jgi:hypothetical protein
VEILDKILWINGYVLVKAEDGSTVVTKGSSTLPLGDLVAYFSSASEAIANNLSLGTIDYVSLCCGEHRVVIFPHESKYLGVEVEKSRNALEVMKSIKSSLTAVEPPKFELPRSISAKVQQINLLVDEFGGQENKEHWVELLNQGLGILGGEISHYIGVSGGKLIFKDRFPDEKTDDFVQGLRSVIDFLVKKGVLEMGSSQARLKVQSVIERMK